MNTRSHGIEPVPTSGPDRISGWWWLAIAILLALVPTAAYPPTRDPSLFLTGGKIINQGGMPYTDFWDIKPPLVYLLYGLAAGTGDLLFAWYRLRALDILLACISCLALARIGSRLLGREGGLAAGAWYLAILLFNGPDVLAQADGWANAFVTSALALRLSPFYGRHRAPAALCLGVLAGLACSLKPTSALPLLAGLGALCVLAPGRGFNEATGESAPAAGSQTKKLRGRPLAGLSFILGMALPLAALALWLQANHAWGDLQDITQNFIRAYLGEGNGPWLAKIRFYTNALLWQASLAPVVAIAVLLGMMERRAWQPGGRPLVWVLALAGFAAMWSQGRAIHYQFQVLAPALSLLAAAGTLGFARVLLPRANPARLALTAALPALLYTLFFGAGRTAAAGEFLTGRTTLEQYATALAWPPGRPEAAPVVQLARFIRQNSSPQDRIMVWVNLSELYVWADRLPSNRFLHASGLVGVDAPEKWRQEFLQSLQKEPPKYFVVSTGEDFRWLHAPMADPLDLLHHWKELYTEIATRYSLPVQMGNLLVYERREQH